MIDAERSGLSLRSVFSDAEDVAIAAVTAAELLTGVELAEGPHRRAREDYVESVFGAVLIEDYDLAVARAHAGLVAHTRRSGRARGTYDLIIAATAVATERVVVTTDARGFADLPGVTVRRVERGNA